ncbi:MAG: restriction endonuclease subunit S [Anaerolineae bacterium]|nr:restriction endonuclease subunit S [Anaerolineae bacterium]
MMKWKTVRLGDVAQAIRGVTFSSGEAEARPFDDSIACLTTSGVQGEVNWSSRRYIPLDRVRQEKQRLKIGDILVSTANSKELVGKSSFVDSLPFSSTFGAFVTVVRPNQNIVPYYLAKWMKTSEFLNSCYIACSNTTNISNLRVSELMAFEMPLPPLAEQQRIVGILARADRLRQLRRYALQLSDGYLQSVFLQMFGDPVTNPMGWEIRPLGDLIVGFEGGVNFPPVSDGEVASDWRVLKISSVTWGDFNPLESKPIKPNVKFDDSLIVRKGDLIISRANTTELVGAVSMVRQTPPKVLLPDKLWRIKTKEDSNVLPDFVLFVLRQDSLRQIIGVLATGSSGSMKNISKAKAATLPIPLASMKLQEQFTCIVNRYEQLRAQQHEAARQADHLFATLLHRAFRGKL